MANGDDIWKPLPGDSEGRSWVGHQPSNLFPVYTRGNAGEVYPGVFTPLSFSIAAEAGERAMRAAALSSGMIRRSELEQIPVTTAVGSGVFGGYAYLNLSMLRLISARTIGGKATDADVSFLGGADEAPPHVPLPFEKNTRASLAGVRYAVSTVRRRELPELAEDQRLVDRYLGGLTEPAEADDKTLRNSIDQLMEIFPHLFERHLTVSFAAGMVVNILSTICEREFEDPQLSVQLLGGLGDVDSAAPSTAMWDLSRQANRSELVEAAFDEGVDGLLAKLEEANDQEAAAFLDGFGAFLADYGSRGPSEWDTAFDTWETDPRLALTLIDRMRAVADAENPADKQAKLAADAATVRTELAGRLSRPSRAIFNRVLDSAKLYSRSRERSKTTVVKAIHGARLQSQELDRRLFERGGGQSGDLWFITEPELDAYLENPGSIQEAIAERRATHALLSEREPPFIFNGDQPPVEQWELKSATRPALGRGETLTGLAGCPGVATGTARVVTNPGDPRGLQPGDVLVAPLTDPAWTPLFLSAQAVVVDVGAVMSHAVIVSRELGIPCVISATDATKRIANGATIEVDGTKGTVTVLS